MSVYRIASLFAGAGGLDLGFDAIPSYKLVWANDNDPDATATYSANLGTHIVQGDIRGVPSDSIPDVDVVLGGFPCQGFSFANTGRHPQDERNRLYLEMLRVVEDKSPRAFVAENVLGLVHMQKGLVLRRIVEDFEDLGYDVQWKVLNSADFGVPQIRRRVFIVGTKKGTGGIFSFPSPSHSESGGGGLKKWVSVGEALSALPDPDEKNSLFNHTYSKYKLRFNGYLGHRFVDPDRPAPTVTGRGDNRGGVVVLHHPSNERRMSVRELATVQSFPLDFLFECNQSAAYRLIGNAVAPMVGRAIAASLLDFLRITEAVSERNVA